MRKSNSLGAALELSDLERKNISGNRHCSVFLDKFLAAAECLYVVVKSYSGSLV